MDYILQAMLSALVKHAKLKLCRAVKRIDSKGKQRHPRCAKRVFEVNHNPVALGIAKRLSVNQRALVITPHFWPELLILS